MFYVSKQFASSVAGERDVDLACEQCGRRFRYRLSREGSGAASAPYYLFAWSGQERADRRARRDLRRRLDRGAELVSCPRCRWVNQPLIDAHRADVQRGLLGAAAVMSVVLLVAAGLVWEGWIEAGRRPDEPVPVATAIFPVALAAAGTVAVPAAWCWRRLARRRIDPNRDHPGGRPDVPPGTPPALVEHVDPTTGRPRWVVAVTPDRVDEVEDDPARVPWADHADGDSEPSSPWSGLVVEFRPGGLVLPDACAECLGEPETTYDVPFHVRDPGEELPLPLCRRCARRLRAKWWLLLLASLAGSAALGASVLVWPGMRGTDELGRYLLGGLIGCFVAMFAAAMVPSHFTRPYRLRWLDAGRGIRSLRVRNPAYATLLAEHVRRVDVGDTDPF